MTCRSDGRYMEDTLETPHQATVEAILKSLDCSDGGCSYDFGSAHIVACSCKPMEHKTEFLFDLADPDVTVYVGVPKDKKIGTIVGVYSWDCAAPMGVLMGVQ